MLADLAAGVPGHFRQHRDRAGAGDLRADRQPRAVDRVRVSAARPLSLCARRQPARRRAERHLGQALRHARLRRRRARSPPSPASCCSRSCRSARARSGRNICCRPSPRRCSARPRSGPGRVNVWGTVLAVAVLAVTVAGLNQLGAPFFVEPLFNGSMLILAVGLAVQAAQRRTAPRHAKPTGRPLPPRPRRSSNRSEAAMNDETAEPASADSPVLGRDWFNSRWGREDQRGNGNLMTPAKGARGDQPHQDRRDRQPGHALRRPHAARARPRLCAAHARRPDRRTLWRRRAGRSGTTSSSRPRSARSARRWTRSAISAACAGRAATRPTCSSTTATAFGHVVALRAEEARHGECAAVLHPRRAVRRAGPEGPGARCRRGDHSSPT